MAIPNISHELKLANFSKYQFLLVNSRSLKPDYTVNLTDIQFKKRNFKEQNGLTPGPKKNLA